MNTSNFGRSIKLNRSPSQDFLKGTLCAREFFSPLPGIFFPRTCCISIGVSVQTLQPLLGDSTWFGSFILFVSQVTWPHGEVLAEILYGDLARTAPLEILYRDIANSSVAGILPRSLALKFCQENLPEGLHRKFQ